MSGTDGGLKPVKRILLIVTLCLVITLLIPTVLMVVIFRTKVNVNVNVDR